MISLLILMFSILTLSFPNHMKNHAGAISENELSCRYDQKCVIVDQCPHILMLMCKNEFSIHRFRQVICGYDAAMPKICCDINRYPTKPNFNDRGIEPSSEIESNCKCGRSLIRRDNNMLGIYPYVARIGFINIIEGDIKYPCNGVIINERTIVTTASCVLVTSERYKLYSVNIGEFATETNPDCNSLFCSHETRNYNISYVIKYPSYHPETFTNNIALIRTQKSIDFTATAQPACLLSDTAYVGIGTVTTLVGWGKLFNQRAKSTIQQELEMTLLPTADCFSFLRQGLSVELCAIGQEVPCSGFSGSPLLYKHDDGYFLIGILSYGSNCDISTKFPSVFVNLRKYSRWISENS